MLRQSLPFLGIAASFLFVSLAHVAAAGADAPRREDGQVTTSHGIETQHVEDSVIETDRTGKGAVLCAWGIYEAIRTVGRECHKKEDIAFRNELDRSLSSIDAFIITNGHTTKAELKARRMEGVRQLHSSGSVCLGEPAKVYEMVRARGAAALHAETVDLLSIPRKPVMNPCL